MIQSNLYMASGFIYEYDDQDRLTRQFNGTKTIEYLDYVDDLPMQINTTDQFSNTKIQRYFYDDKRNIVLEMDQGGYCKEYFRNEDTNLTETRSYHKDQPTLYYATKTQKDITNHTSTEYTGFFDNGVEQKVVYSYHPNQNVDQMIDANGQIYRYGYDPLNGQQLEFSTLYHGTLFSNQMHYQNDLMTRLSHEGTNYYFDYDGQDRLTKIRIGDQQQVSIAYHLSTDGKTYTTTKSFANGYQFVQQVDEDGKIKNKNYGGTNFTYTYNEEDLLTKINSEFESYTFSYDTDNLLLSQSFSCPYQTVSESYEYEKQRLISSTFLYNNQETTTTYTYDDQDRLSSALFSQVCFTLDYDILSRINQEKIITQSNLTLEKNKKYLHTPTTATDLIKEEEIVANDQRIAHYQYQYTPSGNLLSIENEGKTITYHYDELHRLIREDNPYMNQTYTFQYDGAGNILSKKEYAYSLQSLLSQPSQTYTYLYQNTQWKDQLTKITTNDSSYNITYDTMGYPTSMANHTLTWNKSGTLNQWDQTTYEYNIENQLIQKVGNGITTNYYAINHKIHQINIGTNILKFFYALDKLVYFTYNGTRYFYVFNAQNDITHLVDDTGNIVASYIYDAWGNHQVLDASGIENTSADFIGNINPYRYRGYLYDTDSGLYYCNARYYSPELCRWISPDSIEYLDSNTIGGLNLYCYCMNNPINYVDPSGHFPWLILAAVLFSPIGGFITQTVVSAISYVGMSLWALGDLVFNDGKGAWADMCRIKWNPFNADESKVMDSNNISFYKGVPVFHISGMGGSMSLGAIFFDKEQKASVLNHERGHNTQLMFMGPANFLIQIGIPSIWKNGDETPWELSASILGGSTLANDYSEKQKQQARNYFIRSLLPIINIYNIFQYLFY